MRKLLRSAELQKFGRTVWSAKNGGKEKENKYKTNGKG